MSQLILYSVGIQNNGGENNCFLNVLIHLFYNIDELKTFIIESNENTGIIVQMKVK